MGQSRLTFDDSPFEISYFTDVDCCEVVVGSKVVDISVGGKMSPRYCSRRNRTNCYGIRLLDEPSKKNI